MTPMTVGDLTAEHVGLRIESASLDSIQGWLPHLLLSSVRHGNGETTLMFRWDDDPAASNTKRGEFAIGVTVLSDTICSVSERPPDLRNPGAVEAWLDS